MEEIKQPNQVPNPVENLGGDSSSSMPNIKRAEATEADTVRYSKELIHQKVQQEIGLSEEDQGLVNKLVEQEEFHTAVKDANIYYAAALAVKEIKVRDFWQYACMLFVQV